MKLYEYHNGDIHFGIPATDTSLRLRCGAEIPFSDPPPTAYQYCLRADIVTDDNHHDHHDDNHTLYAVRSQTADKAVVFHSIGDIVWYNILADGEACLIDGKVFTYKEGSLR